MVAETVTTRRRNDHWPCRRYWMDRQKTVEENFIADPSANIMNYVKFTAVISIALKKYLEDQKILPDNI